MSRLRKLIDGTIAILMILGLVMVLAFWATQSVAQSRNCMPRDSALARLAERYSEKHQAMALSQDGRMLEILANLETGSWTILLTHPGGITCLVAAGEAYERVAETLPPEGDPT